MFAFSQLICHLIGDYILQSHWMASDKTKSHLPAAVHATVYTSVFLFLTFSIPALLVIGVTHFFIDRFRLARYVCWYKNYIAPRSAWPQGQITATGYADSVPVWLSTWLLIITDNAMHLIINGLALYYLA
jgi:hypothetical protein